MKGGNGIEMKRKLLKKRRRKAVKNDAEELRKKKIYRAKILTEGEW